MFQLKRLGLLVLFSSVIPLYGMHEIDNIGVLLDAFNEEIIVPPIAATLMTTVAALPHAMIYVPFDQAVRVALTSGAMAGCVSTIGYALPMILYGFWCGVDQSPYCDSSFSCAWRKPLYVSFTTITAAVMLCINQRILMHNFEV